MRKRLYKLRGFTLIELMITIGMFALIIGVSAYLFRAVVLSWSSAEERRGVDITLYRAMEEVVRSLRLATQIGSVNDDEVRFTQDDSAYYVYYLYSPDDSYPADFDQDSYDLRLATLVGGINGTFTLGTGKLILSDILPPATSDISISGNVVSVDFSVTRNSKTVRSRTEVRPRNL